MRWFTNKACYTSASDGGWSSADQPASHWAATNWNGFEFSDSSNSSFEVVEAPNRYPEGANRYPEADEDGFEDVLRIMGENILNICMMSNQPAQE